MPEQLAFDTRTLYPSSNPTCCPDAYLCVSGEEPEIECPRHGGFTVCCDRPDLHVPQDPKVWHESMYRYEQTLLNAYLQRLPIVEDFGYEPSDPAFVYLLIDDL